MGTVTIVKRLLLVAALACPLGQVSAQPHPAIPPPVVHHGFTVGSAGCPGPIYSDGGDVVVGGPVSGDVTVIHGSVTMQKGGSVSGTVTVADGGFDNSVGAPVGAVKITRDVPAQAPWGQAGSRAPEFDAKAWVRGAFAWAVLWLVIATVAQLAAPRRSYMVHAALDARPWMMGLLGVATLGAAAVLACLTVLFFSNPVLAPLGAVLLVVIGLLIVGVMALGYSAGLEHFGGEVLRRFRRPEAGPVASRSMAIGLLFVFKLVPILAFAAVIFDGLLLLAGVGAAVHTGLGSARGWLPARMRTHTVEAGL